MQYFYEFTMIDKDGKPYTTEVVRWRYECMTTRILSFYKQGYRKVEYKLIRKDKIIQD